MSSSGESDFKVARASFDPLRRFLEHFSRVILHNYRGHPTFEQQGIQETARNTYEVRYSLGRPRSLALGGSHWIFARQRSTYTPPTF